MKMAAMMRFPAHKSLGLHANASRAISPSYEVLWVVRRITPGTVASAFEVQIASVCTAVPAGKSTALTRRRVTHSSRWI